MKQGNYNKLNDKGFTPEETEIVNQDVIIGKVSPIQPTGNNNKVYKDNSKQFKSNVDGVIDRVHTNVYNSDGYEMINVRIRMEREPVIGDKFCLTDDHEVLTSDGWKQINRVTTDDKVCCLNPEDNTIVYNKPSETYKFDHEGEMYSLKSQQVDLVTTMNHKMYVKKRDRKSFELIEGDNSSWEQDPLRSLARDGELNAYKHYGFWQPMDTLRDYRLLQKRWEEGKALWKTW